MKYVVAVSGGVDSVVLLDMLVRSGEHELVVAHFDHGIRAESADDARFVEGLAKRYGLLFESEQGELGAAASEDTARRARYDFLRRTAAKHGATVATAHHQDDVLETIAINLIRGTGWRGLAVMNDPAIYRPLLDQPKRQLYGYALEHALEWVEDATNATGAYLRNRIRKQLYSYSDTKKGQLIDLWHGQLQIATEIDKETAALATFSRYFLTMIDEVSALELLRATLAAQSLSLDRTQRRRLLHAVKTAQPTSVFEPGGRLRVQFTKRDFIVKNSL